MIKWDLIDFQSLSEVDKGGSTLSNFKSKDLERLIFQVKDKVFKNTGVNLELEVQIIGNNLWKI